MNSKKIGHKSKDFWHREDANVQTYHYCKNTGHINKYCHGEILMKSSEVI